MQKKTKPRGLRAAAFNRYPLLPAPAKTPLPATTQPNYWDALRLESDDEVEFKSEINIDHPQEHWEATDTSDTTKIIGIDNLAHI